MKLFLKDAGATEALGAALARVQAARTGGVIYLQGDLGAGKTNLPSSRTPLAVAAVQYR